MVALNPLGGSKKVNRNAKIKKKDNSLFSKTISLKSELRMELFGTRGAKNPCWLAKTNAKPKAKLRQANVEFLGSKPCQLRLY